MCVPGYGASKGGVGIGEIEGSIGKRFLLLRTIVPAIGNMDERVLPPMGALGAAAKRERREEEAHLNHR